MLFNNAIFWLFGFYKRESGFNGQEILKNKEYTDTYNLDLRYSGI